MPDDLPTEWREAADEAERHRRVWTGDEEHFGYLDGRATALRACADDLEERTDKPIDAIYEDRNLLACALAQATHTPAGWTPDPESPDEWAIVWVVTPFGQVSWHVPREMAEGLDLRRDDDYEWDGHDRDRKNDVLATWTKDGCPG